MAKTNSQNSWLGGGVETLTPEERREKIRALESERLRIEEELQDAVRHYVSETGKTALRVKKPHRNSYLLDNAAIGTEDLDDRPVTGKLYIKSRKKKK